MILTGDEIEQCIEIGEIRIEPFDAKNIKGASYTFTLGETLRKLAVRNELDSRVDPALEDVKCPAEGLILNAHEHILGVTREKVTLNGKFACLLSTRATIAMMGLDVMQGSSWCEPDTDNTFTLEISNNSTLPVRLFPGIKVVKGIFFRVQ